MNFGVMGRSGIEKICLARDRDQLRDPVNAVKNLPIP
jgi:hypothetical protein